MNAALALTIVVMDWALALANYVLYLDDPARWWNLVAAIIIALLSVVQLGLAVLMWRER